MITQPVCNQRQSLLTRVPLGMVSCVVLCEMLSAAPPVPIETRDVVPFAGTYIGGTRGDGLGGIPIVRDAQGNIYIAGRTNSDDIPGVSQGYQPARAGGRDVFIAKLTPDFSTLLAATYLGGTSHDGEWPGVGLALDAEGCVYVIAETLSEDFPVFPGVSYDWTYNGGADVFIAKLTPNLDELLAATFLGGDLADDANCILVDDYVYIVGYTGSLADTFPTTPGAFQRINYAGGHHGVDAFVAKLDKNLTTLVASTFLGRNGDEFPEMLILDEAGNIVLPGWTTSQDFPTSPDSYSPNYNGGMYDAFLTKLSPDLSTLVASTFLGGNDWEFGYAVAIDAEQNIYITGHTASAAAVGGFPTTPGAFDRDYNGAGGADVGDDVFVSKFDSNLRNLLASTFLGGEGWENGAGLAVDDYGFVYVTGSTSSTTFPTTTGAFRRFNSGGDVQYAGDIFLTRMDADLTMLYASTYFGGTGNELLSSILIAPGGSVNLSLGTGSSGLPVSPNAFDPDFNGGASMYANVNWGGDCFLACFDRTLCACYGDLNGDGQINLADLAQLLGNYGRSSGAAYADGDLSADGDIDLADLAALLSRYGRTCD